MRFTHLLAVALFAENIITKMGNCLPGTDWSDATVLWEDQFSGGELSDVWGYELADSWQYGFSQFGNFEQQWYTEDAVRVAKGKLRITAEYHKDPKVVRDLCWDECYQRCVAAGKRSGTADFDGCMDGCGNTGRRCENLGERGITSGRVQTKKGVVPPPSKEYPAIRVEMRVKMPEPGLGLWGAAWLLPPKDEPTDAPGEGLSGVWPRSGEIDVMELANQFRWVSVPRPTCGRSPRLSLTRATRFARSPARSTGQSTSGRRRETTECEACRRITSLVATASSTRTASSGEDSTGARPSSHGTWKTLFMGVFRLPGSRLMVRRTAYCSTWLWAATTPSTMQVGPSPWPTPRRRCGTARGR